MHAAWSSLAPSSSVIELEGQLSLRREALDGDQAEMVVPTGSPEVPVRTAQTRVAKTSTEMYGSYGAVLATAQAKVELVGTGSAAAAACAQFADAMVGGIWLEHNPHHNIDALLL